MLERKFLGGVAGVYSGSTTATSGIFGIGGTSGCTSGNWYCGGAGGRWMVWRPAGDLAADLVAVGGSGWVYTEETFNTWNTGNPTDAANWKLDETYYLTDAETKAGNDSTIPTHDGKSTMTGNSGNGYAKITFIGK